jgi:opacity protein-like surface antigen
MIKSGCKCCITGLIGIPALLLVATSGFSASGHFYLGASLAASSMESSHSDPKISYFSGTIITDRYPLKDEHETSPVLGVNGGYAFTHEGSRWMPALALGLGVYTNLSDYNYKGRVVERANGDPASALYNYKYQVNSTRLMAEAQFNWMMSLFSPFINVGVGEAWNKLNDYHERSFDMTSYPPLPPFHSHSNSNFAWQLGVGLSKAFHYTDEKSGFAQDVISVGYRYANLGDASSGIRGSIYPHKLNIGTLQTSDVYLSYTHLF